MSENELQAISNFVIFQTETGKVNIDVEDGKNRNIQDENYSREVK